MNEFWNIVITGIAMFLVGLAVHSGFRHVQDRGEEKKMETLREIFNELKEMVAEAEQQRKIRK